MRVLYLSFDGILEHVVYSQVARPLRRLAKRGIDYDLVTLEKPDRLADGDKLARVRRRVDGSGIDWTFRPYETGGGVSAAWRNLRNLFVEADATARREHPDLIHARGYLAAAVALALRRLREIPYLFDFRGFWVDVRLEAGRWFADPFVLPAARAAEIALFQGADGIVSLTEVAAEDIRRNRFGPVPEATELEVIPTCVDYRDFELGDGGEAVPAEIRRELADKLVVGYVGSIHSRYRIDRSMQLLRAIHERGDDVHIVCLTSQTDEMRALLDAHEIPGSARLVRTVDHEAMPGWLNTIDWGLLLTDDAISNRAMMPTKLAEFLACGVRPIQYGCNTEVQQCVADTGTGIALHSTSEAALREAADAIVARHREENDGDLREARRRAKEHFSLESGIERYEELIGRIMGTGNR
ncbi:MAG: glycosyltransferase [Bradymonadaceae bacterium]